MLSISTYTHLPVVCRISVAWHAEKTKEFRLDTRVIQQIGKVDEDRVKLALVAALVGMKVLVADVCV